MYCAGKIFQLKPSTTLIKFMCISKLKTSYIIYHNSSLIFCQDVPPKWLSERFLLSKPFCFVSGTYQPSHDLMLRFYAYFKQATEGPNLGPKPSFWEVVKKAKWDAWTKLGNMPKTDAMVAYVEELNKVYPTDYLFF